MIDYINGLVARKGTDSVTIEIAGIGFNIMTTANSLSQITLGEQCLIHTDMIVREDNISLVGFVDQQELDVYRMLTTVKGVGPKSAVQILSSIPYGLFCTAIAGRDLKLLQSAQGVGKKTAERLILELKDKVSEFASGTPAGSGSAAGKSAGEGSSSTSSAHADALEGLISLGYSRQESVKLLAGFDTQEMTAEEIIRQALKSLLQG